MDQPTNNTGRQCEFQVVQGETAEAWLRDPAKLDAWQRLYAATDDPNPFLSPEFAAVWIRHYRNRWTLVLVAAFEAEKLQGLMPLALRNGVITGVGAHQAEYQGWLSNCPNDAIFLRGALNVLRNSFSGTTVRLQYVIGAQADAVKQLAQDAKNVHIKLHSRPLVTLDSATLAGIFRKRSNKNKINRLKRHGEFEFTVLSNFDELEQTFDDITALYDFRQGAIHDCCPFASDPEKKAFHLDWFRSAPGQLRISCLRLNQRVVAGTVAVVGNGGASLAIPAYSAEYSKESLGRLVIYFAAKRLAEDGKRCFDLTPGGDAWKREVATKYVTALELNAYPSAFAARRVYVAKALRRVARRMLVVCGVAPAALKRALVRMRRLNLRNFAVQFRRLRPVYRELRIYRFDLTERRSRAESVDVKVNSVADLLGFSPTEPWQSRGRFLSRAMQRVADGHKVYTVCDGQRLAHFGWLAPSQEKSLFSEVGRHYSYPRPGAVLYDFYTVPVSRNQGLYRTTVARMLADLRRDRSMSVAYISVLADNHASRHVIETFGPSHIASVFCRRFSWYKKAWEVRMS